MAGTGIGNGGGYLGPPVQAPPANTNWQSNAIMQGGFGPGIQKNFGGWQGLEAVGRGLHGVARPGLGGIVSRFTNGAPGVY